MSFKSNFVIIIVALILIVNINAAPLAQGNIGQQIAYQNAVLQHQVANNVNQIANQVNYQANMALYQAQVQQAQIAHAVNNIASQTVGR